MAQHSLFIGQSGSVIEAGEFFNCMRCRLEKKRRLEQSENSSDFSEPKRITCHETLKKKVRTNKNFVTRLEMAGCNDKKYNHLEAVRKAKVIKAK